MDIIIEKKPQNAIMDSCFEFFVRENAIIARTIEIKIATLEKKNWRAGPKQLPSSSPVLTHSSSKDTLAIKPVTAIITDNTAKKIGGILNCFVRMFSAIQYYNTTTVKQYSTNG